MDREQIVAAVRRFTYKPECTFGVQFAGVASSEFAVFTVLMPVPSTVNGMTIFLGSQRYVLEALVTLPMIAGTLLEMTVGLEMHELDEWLRFDGQPLRDPHPLQGISATTDSPAQ